MKNIDIVNAINGLNRFVDKDKAVPIKVSYAISKNLKELKKHYEPYEESRQNLLKRQDDYDQQKLDDEFKMLCDIDVDVEIYKLSLDEIEKIDELTAKDYMALEFMLTE